MLEQRLVVRAELVIRVEHLVVGVVQQIVFQGWLRDLVRLGWGHGSVEYSSGFWGRLRGWEV